MSCIYNYRLMLLRIKGSVTRLGKFFKALSYKFSDKSSPNIQELFKATLKKTLLLKLLSLLFEQLLGNFGLLFIPNLVTLI